MAESFQILLLLLQVLLPVEVLLRQLVALLLLLLEEVLLRLLVVLQRLEVQYYCNHIGIEFETARYHSLQDQ